MNFTGDIDVLSESQLKLIENVLKEKGFSDASVTVFDVGLKGDNYAASVKRVTAEHNGKTLKMIAKIAPTDEVVRQMLFSQIIFNNEITIYQKVFPKFLELQKEVSVPIQEIIKFPECYGTIADSPYEFVLLEDLKERKYEMRNRMESLNNDEVKLALERLATFHSLSFILRKKEPGLFEELSNKLKDLWVLYDHIPQVKVSFKDLEDNIYKILVSEDIKKQIPGSVQNALKLSSELCLEEKSSRYSVINQGDCWTNNIMFKYEEDHLKDCILIDYQISRLSSPAQDLLYLILNCTDHETRVKHYHDWIDFYHQQLDKTLVRFDLKAIDIYPKDKLDADLKRYGKLALGLSLVLSTVLTRGSDDVFDIKEAVENEGSKNISEGTVTRLKKRVEELFASLSEFELL